MVDPPIHLRVLAISVSPVELIVTVDSMLVATQDRKSEKNTAAVMANVIMVKVFGENHVQPIAAVTITESVSPGRTDVVGIVNQIMVTTKDVCREEEYANSSSQIHVVMAAIETRTSVTKTIVQHSKITSLFVF